MLTLLVADLISSCCQTKGMFILLEKAGLLLFLSGFWSLSHFCVCWYCNTRAVWNVISNCSLGKRGGVASHSSIDERRRVLRSLINLLCLGKINVKCVLLSGLYG